MIVDSFEAAKKLCHLSNWTITNLKLQKILYLSQMVSLGRTSEPLMRGTFEAWDYGPVLPSVYHHLKIFGADPVKDRFYDIDVLTDTPEAKLLEETWKALGHKDGWELVSIAHRPNGAWAKNYSPGLNRVISDTDILEEYRHFYAST